MINFLKTGLFLVIFPLIFFTTCHQATDDAKLSEYLQALEEDDTEMVQRFKLSVQQSETIDLEEEKEFKALNLALDQSAKKDVEAILTQVAATHDTNIKPSQLDSAAVDSMLTTA